MAGLNNAVFISRNHLIISDFLPVLETTSRAILNIGSLTNHPSSHSGFNSAVPGFEVTSRLPNSIFLQHEKPSSTDFFQAPGLQAFSIPDEEETDHSIADEEERLLRFKQRATETSVR